MTDSVCAHVQKTTPPPSHVDVHLYDPLGSLCSDQFTGRHHHHSHWPPLSGLIHPPSILSAHACQMKALCRSVREHWLDTLLRSYGTSLTTSRAPEKGLAVVI